MGLTSRYKVNKTDTGHIYHEFTDESHNEGFDYQEDVTVSTYGDNFSKPREAASNKFQKKNLLFWIAGIGGVITKVILPIITGKITDIVVGFLAGVGNVSLFYVFYLIIRDGDEF